MDVAIKRIYEAAADGDGSRILIDRVWPRGVRKPDAKLDHWCKDAAPSTALRKWFAHDPAKWKEFRSRYWAELDANPQAVQPLIVALRRGPVTLLFAAKDVEHSNAQALREYLLRKAGD